MSSAPSPPPLLLDTHALVWLVEGDAQLAATAQRAIAAAPTVWISAITPWEIGMLVAQGRLTLAKDVQEWMDEVLALTGLRLAPLSPAVAIASSRLPGELHGDPADRLIAATARHLDVTLVTADVKLLGYAAAGHLKVLAAR